MQEFLFVAYNEQNLDMVSIDKPNLFMKEKGYSICDSISESGMFMYSRKIQYARINNGFVNKIPSLLIKGNTTGIYPNNNKKNLSDEEILTILKTTDLVNKDLQFEGSLTFLYELENGIIFQNDIEGFRKIFYYYKNGVLCVSSFMPLILMCLQKKWTLNYVSALRFLSSRESLWPSTLVSEINVLEPKSKAIILNNEIKIKNYTYSELLTLNKKSIKRVEDDLKNICFNHLSQIFEENKVLMTLSGGFDSSNLLSFASKSRRKDLQAISVGYDTIRTKDANVYNETIYAQKVADFYSVPVSKFVVDKKTFFKSFESLMEIIDQPALDPSSFNLMSLLTLQLNKTALVSAMGGDALFSSKLTVKLYLSIFKFVRLVPDSLLQILNNITGRRAPFNFFSEIYYDGIATQNPFVPLDRLKLSRFMRDFYHESSYILMEEYRNQQLKYWENVILKSKTKMDLIYSVAALSNPGEYHAFTVAERQGVVMSQPLVKIDFVIEVINASNYYSHINSRKFLCHLFGVNKKLLYKGKSGFSIPYADWCQDIADETFRFWMESSEISKYFDINKFYSVYNQNRSLHSYNIIVWKLYVLMRYMRIYSIK